MLGKIICLSAASECLWAEVCSPSRVMSKYKRILVREVTLMLPSSWVRLGSPGRNNQNQPDVPGQSVLLNTFYYIYIYMNRCVTKADLSFSIIFMCVGFLGLISLALTNSHPVRWLWEYNRLPFSMKCGAQQCSQDFLI